MEEGRVADYFVIAGLPPNPQPVEEDYAEGLTPNFKNIEPITDITVIFPTLGEFVPRGYECVEKTPSGYAANLNSGSLRSHEIYLCFKRGRDKPPLVDIGVMYDDGKERLLPDSEVVISTPTGRGANVNNTASRILLTYRRGREKMPTNELVVTDVCVIISNKGEKAPHAYCLIDKNLNKGTIMGSNVYICYKKSSNRPPLIPYKAEILLRYPFENHANFPLPPSVPLFCLPMCASLELWPRDAQQPNPVFSTYVLTVSDATQKVYGAAVTFYEEYEGELSEEQKKLLGITSSLELERKSVHVNKSISILSHFSFFDTYKTFLLYLYNLSRDGAHEVPIERYISHLLSQVILPSPQRPHILMQLSATQNVLISHPHDTPLPKSGASFRLLLQNLGADNCSLLLSLVLSEQKLLLHSLRPDVLTSVVEAVSLSIFPLSWQCPYIPLCPLSLCSLLQAPLPYLIGVDSRLFDLYELPGDVTAVDLDTKSISVCEDKKGVVSSKLLPKKARQVLKSTLENLEMKIYELRLRERSRGGNNAMEFDFQLQTRERLLELEIQECFLQFMTSILRGYRKFLLPITRAPSSRATDATSLFDFPSFLKSRERSTESFFSILVRTQMFIRFIEERSFVSPSDRALAFFDEISERSSDESDGSTPTKSRFLDFSSSPSDRTLFIPPPDPPKNSTPTLYSYGAKFNLKKELFFMSGERGRGAGVGGTNNTNLGVAKRTKEEVRGAQRAARKYSTHPVLWAKYLLSTTYTLWFLHLPSYLKIVESKHGALVLALEMLVRMGKAQLQPKDEVCYRVVLQLSGIYSHPVIAVKVLFEMKRLGMTPNAITYGFYNRAVLEAQWPSNVNNSSQLMWNKLRNVILGVAHFRSALRRDESNIDRKSSSSDIGYVSMLENERGGESSNSKFWDKVGLNWDSFIKNSVSSLTTNMYLGGDYEIFYPNPNNQNENTIDSVDNISNISNINIENNVLNEDKMRGNVRRKLDFENNRPNSTMRLLRSVSFGNDKEIMSKLTNRNETDTSKEELCNLEEEGEVSDPLGVYKINKNLNDGLTPKRTWSEGEIGTSPLGLLRKTGLNFHRSSTLPNSLQNEGTPTSSNSSIQAPEQNNVISSLTSSLKSFSRYSPGRMSLRKAGTSLLESTIGNKKAEAFLEGFNSFKSAATETAKKKLDEIKVAINSPAVSRITRGEGGEIIDSETSEYVEDDKNVDQWGSVSESYLDQILSPSNQNLKESTNERRGSLFSQLLRSKNDKEDFNSTKNLNNTPDNNSDRIVLFANDGTDGNSISEEKEKSFIAHKESVNLNLSELNETLPFLLNSSTSNNNRRKDSNCENNPIGLRIILTTVSLCHSCSSLIYDEEIMGGWSAEDSNLNTKCTQCRKSEVPFLQVSLRDFRNSPHPSSLPPQNLNETPHDISSASNYDPLGALLSENTDSPTPTNKNNNSTTSNVTNITSNVTSSTSSNISNSELNEGVEGERVIVPYLSPLVLRKEFENILEQEGEGALLLHSFVDDHPIIYWNLLWFFDRADLVSHLKGLALGAESTRNKNVKIHESWEGVNSWETVEIQCKWDSENMHSGFTKPLYKLHLDSKGGNVTLSTETEKLISEILKTVSTGGDLSYVCSKLLHYYHKEGGERHFPTYRDILFLALTANEKETMDLYGFGFDRDYRIAYSRLRNSDEDESMSCGDAPPLDSALFCRKLFKKLELP